MNRAALKDLVYGGIEEMSQNPRLYAYSSIGSTYNSWTNLGKENVVEFLNMVAGEMHKCRRAEDEQRSRDMVLRELKS